MKRKQQIAAELAIVFLVIFLIQVHIRSGKPKNGRIDAWIR